MRERTKTKTRRTFRRYQEMRRFAEVKIFERQKIFLRTGERKGYREGGDIKAHITKCWDCAQESL